MTKREAKELLTKIADDTETLGKFGKFEQGADSLTTGVFLGDLDNEDGTGTRATTLVGKTSNITKMVARQMLGDKDVMHVLIQAVNMYKIVVAVRNDGTDVDDLLNKIKNN